MTEQLYRGPNGAPVDVDSESQLIRCALNDAWGFEYHAPTARDWWDVFWESLERHQHSRLATGQLPISGWS